PLSVAAMTPRYLTTAEAADYCRYRKPSGLLKAHARGLVHAYKRGRTYLWLREDLDAFLSAGGSNEVGESLGLRGAADDDAGDHAAAGRPLPSARQIERGRAQARPLSRRGGAVPAGRSARAPGDARRGTTEAEQLEAAVQRIRAITLR